MSTLYSNIFLQRKNHDFVPKRAPLFQISMKSYCTLLALTCTLGTFAQSPNDSIATRTDSIPQKDQKLSSALIVGQRQNKVENAAMGITYLRPEHIRSIPTMFGEADIIKALQMQPGVSAGVDGFAGMMVRGGDSDQNLFLIDGNPIYQMNHAGGLFSAYNIEAVRDVAFYKSSFPARYGGRLSSVVDIITKPGDSNHYKGSFSIGLTSANINFGGPIIKNRTSFNVSMRRSWLDALTTPALAIANNDSKSLGEKSKGAYAFTDFNLMVNHRFEKYGTLSLVGYYGVDNLSLGYEDWSVDVSYAKNKYHDKSDLHLKWGNFLTALKWSLPVGDQWVHNLNLAYTRYNSKFGVAYDYKMGEKGTPSYSHEYADFDVVNGIDDVSLRSQWLWSFGNRESLRFGLDYTLHRFTPEQNRQHSSNTNITFADNEPAVHAHETALYADAELRPTDWFQVNAGLRFSDFLVREKNYLMIEPRLSANFRVSPSVSFKAGYARMTQFVQQVSNTYISLPTDYWMPVTDRHAPLVSDQYSIGGYYSYKNEWNLSVEGWYKRMSRLLEYREHHNLLAQNIAWVDKLTSGKGTSYGVDFLLEKNFGRVAGFLGYGLLWTERHFKELNQGNPFPSKYDNRHKFNVALSYRATRRIEMNAAWTVMTGNLITLPLEDYNYSTETHPLTPKKPDYQNGDPVEYVNQRNNFRLPAYHRLDAGINFYRFHKKSGKQSIWNISAYNAYAKKNPIMIQKTTEHRGTEMRARLRGLALFIIVPSISYTLKF